MHNASLGYAYNIILQNISVHSELRDQRSRDHVLLGTCVIASATASASGTRMTGGRDIHMPIYGDLWHGRTHSRAHAHYPGTLRVRKAIAFNKEPRQGNVAKHEVWFREGHLRGYEFTAPIRNAGLKSGCCSFLSSKDHRGYQTIEWGVDVERSRVACLQSPVAL